MFTNGRRDIPLPDGYQMAKMASLHAELTTIPSEYLGEPVEEPTDNLEDSAVEWYTLSPYKKGIA